jgi:hypothetical protein
MALCSLTALMMEVVRASETSVYFYEITLRCTPEGFITLRLCLNWQNVLYLASAGSGLGKIHTNIYLTFCCSNNNNMS